MAHLDMELEQGGGGSALPLPADDTVPQLRFLVGGGNGNGAEITTVRPQRFLASLLLVADRWVVLAPPDNGALAVNRVAVVGFRVLGHGDLIEVHGLRLRLNEERTEVLAADSPLVQQGKPCPVCQNVFAPGDRVVYCPRCGFAHHTAGSTRHADCWTWNGKCASRPFCGFQLRASQAGAPQEESR